MGPGNKRNGGFVPGVVARMERASESPLETQMGKTWDQILKRGEMF